MNDIDKQENIKPKKIKQSTLEKTLSKLAFEKEYIKKGFKYIAGVDEVGRGPLAGPVVCGAVIMKLDENDIIEGIDDSKKVSEKNRIILEEKIKQKAICYNIAEIQAEEIDEINILKAVKKCMIKAVEGLSIKPDITLVDGLDMKLPFNSLYIVKGDSKSYTIGSASILAKVYRDNLMEKYAEIYPDYSFEKNKGYGTKVHIEKIKEIGACKIHRRSFIKNFLEK